MWQQDAWILSLIASWVFSGWLKTVTYSKTSGNKLKHFFNTHRIQQPMQ